MEQLIRYARLILGFGNLLVFKDGRLVCVIALAEFSAEDNRIITERSDINRWLKYCGIKEDEIIRDAIGDSFLGYEFVTLDY